MRRFFVFILLVTGFCSLATASEETAKMAEDVNSLWAAVWSYDVPGERQYYDKLCAEFAEATGEKPPRIELGKWDYAHEQIQGWIKDSNGPDIVVLPEEWLAEFSGGVEDFDKYLDPKLREEFYSVMFNKGIYKGKLLGMVWAGTTKALFYRKDLFEKAGLSAPKTWQEQLEAAIKLNNPPEIYGIGLPGAPVYETDDNLFLYLWSAGGDFFDENGKCIINNAAGVKALQFYVDLVNKYHVTQPEVTSWSRKQTRRLFEAGKLAMFATGPWGIESLRKNAPDIEFGVAPLPVDKRPATQLVTDHIAIFSYSPRKSLAGRFLNFAYQDKYRFEFAKLGLLPEKKSVGTNDYFQKDPYWKVFVDVIPYGKSIPLMDWADIGAAIRQAMYDSLTGRKSPKEALDDEAAAIDKIVEKRRSP